MPDSQKQHAETLNRLESLEFKLMHLENSLSELNDVVLKQYRALEALRNTNQLLEKKLESLEDQGPRPSAADEVPPHY